MKDAFVHETSSASFTGAATRAFLCLTAILFVLLAVFGEKIAVNDGLGYDGVQYTEWTKLTPKELVHAPRLRSDRVARLGPILLVHYSLRLLTVPLTNSNIIKAYITMNCLFLIFSLWLWCKIAEYLSLSRNGVWIGVIALFFNHFTLKFIPYYPVLLDAVSFAMNLAILCAWLSRRFWVLVAAVFLGSFVSPLILFNGVLLVAFPSDSRESSHVCGTPRALYKYAISLGLGSLFYGLGFYGLHDVAIQQAWSVIIGTIHYKYFGISLTISVWFFLSCLFVILDCDSILSPRYLLSKVRPTVLVAISILILVSIIKSSMADPVFNPSASALGNITGNLATSLREPGEFLVAHIVFMGPFLVFALYLANSVRSILHRYGIGMCLVALLAVPFWLCAESRCIIDFFPLLIPFIVKACDQLHWSKRQVCSLAILSIAASKVWLPIGSFQERYFMNFGGWMGPSEFKIQTLMALFISVFIYRYWIRPARSITQNTAGVTA